MKLYADVDVVNRRLASHGMKGSNKKVKSHIAIGKKAVGEGKPELFIMVTNAQNKQGTKYPIQRNIEQVFTKLVNEGKTTIRFKEPDHDLCIKGDPIEVKSFLSVLKKVLNGQDVDKLSLSALQPLSNKQITGPKRKLTVTKRGEYPVKEGFVQTLTHVKINGIRLAKIDSRIMKLVNLTDLDMADNEIEKLPDNWNSVTSLAILNLTNNTISTIPRGFCFGQMIKTLQCLNLSFNKIKLLPNVLCRLTELVSLNLNNNELTQLPPSLGNLSKLKHLTASNNYIKFLPGSVVALRLESLELSNNPLEDAESRIMSNKLESVSTLMEMSGRAVVKMKVQYTDEDVLPHVQRYLESVMFCPCKQPVWNNVARAMVKLQLERIAKSVCCDGLREVIMDASVCSTRCLSTFMNNPFAF